MSDVLQAFVSQGGVLLGYEYFTEPRISIGSGDDADDGELADPTDFVCQYWHPGSEPAMSWSSEV